MAAALLLELHGEVLRALCKADNTHFEGVASAARALARKGVLSARMKKKLTEIDTAAALIRHVTAPRCESFLWELMQELGQHEKIKRATEDPSAALFDGIADGSDTSESSNDNSVISSNAAISACRQGHVILCPQVLLLPNRPCEKGSVSTEAVISCSAAISASETSVQSNSVKGVQSACEKGFVSAEAVISCNAAIAAGEKGSVSTEAVISCSAAISAECEKGVQEAVFSTPVRTPVISSGAAISACEKGEQFVTPPTMSTALPDDEEEEEADSIIMQFLGAAPEVPEFPVLEDVISCSAAISEECEGSAHSEKGSVSTEAVISCSAAISACEKGPEIFDIAKDDLVSDEKGCADAAISEQCASFEKDHPGPKGETNHPGPKGETRSVSKEAVISCSAAISAFPEQAKGSSNTPISYNAAISVLPELDESVDELIARCRTLTAMHPRRMIDEAASDSSQQSDESEKLFLGLCVSPAGVGEEQELVVTGELERQHSMLRVHPSTVDSALGAQLAQLYLHRNGVINFTMAISSIVNGQLVSGRLIQVVNRSGLSEDAELWNLRMAHLATEVWES